MQTGALKYLISVPYTVVMEDGKTSVETDDHEVPDTSVFVDPEDNIVNGKFDVKLTLYAKGSKVCSDLSGLQFTQIPEGIFDTQCLSCLFLGNNKINEVGLYLSTVR